MRWICLFSWCAAALAQPAVTTSQYDNARTGATLAETVLTPRNVAAGRFGKLFTMPVQGDVYAEPLYVPRVEIPGKGARNVLFVATEADAVYAFDADQTGPPLWRVSLVNQAAGVRPVRASDLECSFTGPDIGITATPVIDAAAGAMYLVARTKERSANGHDLFYQRLHALDIRTGQERQGSPVAIRASVEGAPSWFGLAHNDVEFHAGQENARASLLLSNGTVFIAWGSSCDVRPYYGWVLAFDGRTLRRTGVFNTAPNAGESGIWQSDTGIAADAEGNVYAVTGNGRFTAANGGRDYGDSVLKLALQSGGAMAVRDYFTPSNEARLNRDDADLGSSSPLLLPDQAGAHRHLMVAAGKAGVMYVIDRDRMGKFHAESDSHALQAFKAVKGGVYGAPAYWNGHLYYFGSADVLKDFAVKDGRVSQTPQRQGATWFKAGAIPSVSANGASDGIVWTVLTKGFREPDVEASLEADDASDISRVLYSTRNDPGSAPGMAVRFTIPMVANGRVYVGSRNMVYVYGLLGRGNQR